MECYLENGKRISFKKSEFVASGGQGDVFARGDMAYKLYRDPGQMIPEIKIQELEVLNKPEIIRPLELLFTKERKPLGYTMNYLDNNWILCQLYPRSFQKRYNLERDIISRLVDRFRELVRFVHSKGILIVDLNEMNFLVSLDFGKIYFIDVDNYHTAAHPCQAVMASVKDPLMTVPGEVHDWFAWGVVTFQLFMGIHPYKGKHPGVQGLEERMACNLSVFNPEVKIPGICPSLNTIPRPLREWYRRVFEEGLREAPPEIGNEIVMRPTGSCFSPGGKDFKTEELLAVPSGVREIFYADGELLVRTKDTLFFRKRRFHFARGVPGIYGGKVFLARLEDRSLIMVDLEQGVEEKTSLMGDGLFSAGPLIYLKNGERVLELFPGKVTTAVSRAMILPRGSFCFPGGLIQNLLGRYFGNFFPRSGVCYQHPLKELEGARIVSGRFEKQVLMVITGKEGEYTRWIYRFSSAFDRYDCRRQEGVVLQEINFAVLDKGLCLHMTENDELEIFTNRPGDPHREVVPGDSLSGVTLAAAGDELTGFKGEKVFRVRRG